LVEVYPAIRVGRPRNQLGRESVQTEKILKKKENSYDEVCPSVAPQHLDCFR
jgi:hypothetical protein